MSRGEIDILDQKNKVVCKYLSHRPALSFYSTGILVVEFNLCYLSNCCYICKYNN